MIWSGSGGREQGWVQVPCDSRLSESFAQYAIKITGPKKLCDQEKQHVSSKNILNILNFL